MRTLITSLLLALLLGTLSAPAASAAENDWVLVDQNKESTFFYSKNGTEKEKDGVLRVTTRVVYSEKGKEAALKILAASDTLQKLAESRYQHEINCEEKESRLLKVTHLAKDGGPLKTTDLSGVTDWEEIRPDTRMERVLEMVCSK